MLEGDAGEPLTEREIGQEDRILRRCDEQRDVDVTVRVDAQLCEADTLGGCVGCVVAQCVDEFGA